MDRSWPPPVQRVASFLGAAAVDATIQEFPGGTPTAEEAARAAGCQPGRIVKSLVFVGEPGFVLALVPGDRKADERKVAAAAGSPTVRIAAAKEVVSATGFEPGGVAPFPQASIACALLDHSLLQYAKVWIGAGSEFHMASLAPVDLQRLAGARPADLVASR